MNIRDLAVGQQFRFSDLPKRHPWEYRGNGWYGWPYSGGPYLADTTTEVIPLRPLEYVAVPQD